MMPRIKLGAFQDMAANILKEADRNNWDDTETRRQMQLAWNSVDNRFGQMVYDNLFWNRTALDAAQLGIRSVGWQGGTYKEYGGAMDDTARAFARASAWKRPRVTARMGFMLATPIYTAMFAAVMTYLLSGHGPDTTQHGLKAYGMIETADGTMLSIPGYLKNLMGLGEDIRQNTVPWRTAANFASPLLSTSAEMWQNKDYYGNEIHHEDDPLANGPLGKTQATEFGRFLASQYIPFTVKSLQEQRQKAGGGEFSDIGKSQSAGMVALSYLGFQPATQTMQNSPAMNLAEHYRSEFPTAPRTAEQAERSAAYKNLVQALKAGNLNEEKLNEAIDHNKISGRQYSEAVREANETPLERVVSRLNFEQAMRVWEKADAAERQSLKDVMENHAAKQIETVAAEQGDDAAVELEAKMQKLGILDKQ
jgi:hypothetical protein